LKYGTRVKELYLKRKRNRWVWSQNFQKFKKRAVQFTALRIRMYRKFKQLMNKKKPAGDSDG